MSDVSQECKDLANEIAAYIQSTLDGAEYISVAEMRKRGAEMDSVIPRMIQDVVDAAVENAAKGEEDD